MCENELKGVQVQVQPIKNMNIMRFFFKWKISYNSPSLLTFKSVLEIRNDSFLAMVHLLLHNLYGGSTDFAQSRWVWKEVDGVLLSDGQTPRKCIYILGTAGNDRKISAKRVVFKKKIYNILNFPYLFLKKKCKENQFCSFIYVKFVCSFSIYCQIHSASKVKFLEPSSPVPPFSSPLLMGPTR